MKIVKVLAAGSVIFFLMSVWEFWLSAAPPIKQNGRPNRVGFGSKIHYQVSPWILGVNLKHILFSTKGGRRWEVVDSTCSACPPTIKRLP